MEIKIQNLVKQYGKNTVLDIPELTIHSGELVGLVGNNGAGKTTLMRLILDLIEATEGYVETNGNRVNEDSTWKQFTGSFIDGRFLIDFYTPEEYFNFIASVYAIDKDTLNSRLAQYQSLMHDEILGTKKYLREFSEGNRQKIGIIGAMLIRPKVLILDLIEATEGHVEADGRLVNEDGTWKQYTGSFIDSHFLIDFFTPEEYFAFIARVYQLPKDTLDSRLEQFRPLMHDEILGTKKYLRQFSEGNRQKIGIIGAMLINPKVLILDEPFNYLDPTSQITVAKLIRQMKEQLGSTVIISSHNLNFVSEISTRILLLEKGVVIKDLPNQDGSATKELEDYFNTAEQ